MKKKLFLVIFCFLLSYNVSFSLCIACGCDDAYMGCYNTTYYDADRLTENEYNAQMRYCKSERKRCHGTGIRIAEFRNA